MSGTTPNHRHPPPTDEELLNLYEEVRRGFQVEPASTLASDSAQSSLVESIIDQYSNAPSPPPQELPGYSRNMRGLTPPAEKGEASDQK
jgi:hypothetical protein